MTMIVYCIMVRLHSHETDCQQLCQGYVNCCIYSYQLAGSQAGFVVRHYSQEINQNKKWQKKRQATACQCNGMGSFPGQLFGV